MREQGAVVCVQHGTDLKSADRDRRVVQSRIGRNKCAEATRESYLESSLVVS